MTNSTIQAEETLKPLRMIHALNSAMDLALSKDPSVVLLGEDIADPIGGVFAATKGLSTKYGAHRVRATPISETAILGAAVGAALAGMRPVAEIMFFDFMAVCMDPLINHAAKLRYMSGGATPVPMTVRTTIGSNRYGAQHAQSLEAWFMHVPGMKVVYPSNPADAKGLLMSAIFDDDPCLVIENSSLLFGPKQEVPLGEHYVPLGQAATLRAGHDVTLVTYGQMVAPALKAADELAEAGISTEVIDLRSLVPLDMETVLRSAERTRRVVVLHAATQFMGPGAEISARVMEELFGELAAPVVRLGAPYTPIPFSSSLDRTPGAANVVTTVRQLVGG